MSARFVRNFICALIVLTGVARAATVTWTGAGDATLWSDGLNWSGNVMPPAGSDVVIPAAAAGTSVQVTGAAGTVQVATITTSKTLLFASARVVGANVTSPNASLVKANNSSVIFDGVTLGTDFTIVNGATLQIKNGLTLANNAKLTLTSSGSNTNLECAGTQTIGGTGEIVFGGTQPYNRVYSLGGNNVATAATLTLGAGITVHGTQDGAVFGFYNTDSVIYRGTVTADAAGHTITVSGANWSNFGSFNLSGTATLALAGSFALPNFGTLNRTGGTLNLNAVLDLQGGTLSFTNAVTGAWNLVNGTLKNGTVNSPDALSLTSVSSTTNGLDNVMLGCNLTVANSSTVQVRNGLTLANSAKVTLACAGSNTNLECVGTQTIGGTGEIFFAGTQPYNRVYSLGGNNVATAATLTLGAGITVHGTQDGAVFGFYNTDSVIYRGTVTADAAGHTITVSGANWSNFGTFNLTGTATLTLAGSFALPNFGTLNRIGGTLNLNAVLDLQGGTLSFTNAVTGAWNLVNGTLKNGTVNSPDALSLTSVSSTTNGLDNVVLGCNLTIANSSTLQVRNGLTLANNAKLTLASAGSNCNLECVGTQTIGGTGEIVFAGTQPYNRVYSLGGNNVATAATLTLGAGITVHGTQDGAVFGFYNTDGVIYRGTVTADAAGHTITVSGANWSNTGTFNLSGTATLTLAGSFALPNFGTLNRTGGTVNLSAGLDLQGGTLSFTNAVTGAWNLVNGTLKNGTVNSPDALSLTSVSSTTNGLDGVTLGCNLTVANSSTVQVRNGLTLANSAKVTLACAGSNTNLECVGTQTIGGTGEIFFAGTQPYNRVYSLGGNNVATAATLTLGGGVTVRGSQSGAIFGFYNTDNVIYQGQIIIDAAGTAVTLSGSNWQNTGTVSLSGSATLNLAGGFTLAHAGTLVRSGGTVNISGVLDLQGGTLDFNSQTGSWNLAGGTFRNGTLNINAGAGLSSVSGTATLDAITLGGDLTVQNGTTVRVVNDLTLANNARITLASAGSNTNLECAGTETIGGTGELFFGGTQPYNRIYSIGGNSAGTAATLTLGSGVTVRGSQAGALFGFYNTDNLINRGEIISEAAGNAVYIAGSNWSNTGTISISGTAILNLGGGFTLSGLGAVNRTGGTINLNGSLDLQGGTLDFTMARGAWILSSGTILHGTVTSTAGLTLATASGTTSTFDGITLGCNVTVTNSSQLQFYNGLTLANAEITLASTGYNTNVAFLGTQTVSGTGAFVFGGTAPYNRIYSQGNNTQNGAATLTFGPGIGIREAAGTGGGSIFGFYSPDNFVNQGQINVTTGTVSIAGSNWSNTGSLSVSGSGVLSLAGNFTRSGLGTLNNSGVVNLTGVFDLQGGTMAYTAATGVWNPVGGTFKNGTVTASTGLAFPNSGTSTLDGITLGADFTVQNNSTLRIVNGLTLANNARVTLASTGYNTNLECAGTQTIGGTGEIFFGGTQPFNRVYPIGGNSTATAATLTFGAEVTVRGTQSGAIFGFYSQDKITNQGRIVAETSGKAITLTALSFSNPGTLSATNGGTLRPTTAVSIDGSGALQTTLTSAFTTSSSLLGSTTAVATNNPGGTTTFNGSGTAGAPQLMEAMSRDLGATSAAFNQNFTHGRIVLGSNTYVKLVDQSPNTASGAAEAVYVNTLTVPAISTLDLNNLHLYTHTSQVSGAVVNGSVTIVPDVGGSWTGAGDGVSWGDPQNWANNQLPGTTTDVVIGVLPGNPTIKLDALAGTVKIKSLTTSQPINVITGGSLEVTGSVQLSNNLILSGGTIVNSTIASTNGAALVLTASGGSLNNVTIASGTTLDGSVPQGQQWASVVNGLTLNGTALLGQPGNAGNFGYLIFEGTQTLAGNGLVHFGTSLSNGLFERSPDSGTLTIGAGISVAYGSGSITAFGSGGGAIESVILGGTITLGNVDFLTIGGSTWRNTGTINAVSQHVTLTGNFSFSDLGNFNAAGAVVTIAGTYDNTGRTFTISPELGNWQLASGGTVRGGTVVTSGGTTFSSAGGVLDGVTLDSDFTVASSATLTVRNGLTLNNANLIVANSGVSFEGTQTLGGAGEVQFTGAGYNFLQVIGADNTAAGAAVLTFGPGITVRVLRNGAINGNITGAHTFDAVQNLGAIEVDSSPSTVTFDVNFVNQGRLTGTSGGNFAFLRSFMLEGAGTLKISAAGNATAYCGFSGNSTAAAQSDPAGQFTFRGSGTSNAPQFIEVMSADLGPTNDGFIGNFAYGEFAVVGGNYVRLVDHSDNIAGAGAEAVYTDVFTVAAGSTVDLNNLHVYAHTLQVAGAVMNGSVTQVPNPVLATLPAGAGPAALAVDPVTNRLYIANAGGNSVTVFDGATGDSNAVSVGANPGALGVNVATNKVYVANRDAGTVTVITGTSQSGTIAVGNSPQSIAVNPNTNLIYVANRVDNSVSVIDGATDQRIANIPVGVSPMALAVNLVTNRIYVANFGTGGVASPVTVINGATNATTTIPAGNGSMGVAVNAATNKVYVANQLSSNVTVIDGASNSASTIAAGGSPSAILVDPVTNEIFVANEAAGSVRIINGATRAAADIAVNGSPVALAVNSRTSAVYVVNGDNNSVTTINADAEVTTVRVGSAPVAAAVNPITNRVYIANSGSNSVAVLDASENSSVTLPVGLTPSAVAVDAISNRVYTVNAGSNSVTATDPNTRLSTTFNTGARPVALAVNSLTHRVYIANADSANVTVLDALANTTATVSTGASPSAVAVNVVTGRAYVANADGNSVSVIEGSSNAVTTVPVGTSPRALAVNPVLNRIYAANVGSNTVSVIDGETNQVTPVIVGTSPVALAVDPSSGKVYVANKGSANITIIDPVANGTYTLSAGTSLAQPSAVALNPVTHRIYVANGGAGNGTVTVIDGVYNSTSLVTVGSQPLALAVDLLSNLVYVANASGSNLTVIDGVTNGTASIPVGAGPAAIAVNPVTDQVFVANSGAASITAITPARAGLNSLATSTDQLRGHAAGANTATLGLSARSLYGPNPLPVRQIWYQIDSAAGPWQPASGPGAASVAALSLLLPGEHTLYAFATDGQESSALNSGAGSSPVPGQVTAYPFATTGGGSFSLATSTVTAHNIDPSVTLTVQRDFLGPGHVDYTTVSGTALAGTHFVQTQGTLTFPQNQSTATINVPLLDGAIPGSTAYFSVQLTAPGGSSVLGQPSSAGVFLLNDFSNDLTLSNFDFVAPQPAPAAGGSITVNLTPAQAGGQWRLFGELDWRASGDTAGGLTGAGYQVEFKQVTGFKAPEPLAVAVVAGSNSTQTANYTATFSTATGTLRVTLSPAGTGGWRVQGESSFRAGGATATLPAGTQIVEFQSVNGLVAPERREVLVSAGQLTSVASTYFVSFTEEGASSELAANFPTGDPRLAAARACVGQIQTDNGFGTGFVPTNHVALTAAHVLFDDGSLSYVQGTRWFFQREAGAFETPPQLPRGTYLLGGYATQRAADRTPGVSLPASQQLDVAALYFQQPAARGGQGGYLASNSAGNAWLTNSAGATPRAKFIAGYPVSGIPAASTGRLHATPLTTDAFTFVSDSLFKTTAIASFPGNSGGPLFVQLDGDAGSTFYPAGIYLGGTAQTVVRAIDSTVIDLVSRGEVSGRGGPIDIGRGVIRLEGGLSGTTQATLGSLDVILQPASAAALGAQWGYTPDALNRASGELDAGVLPGSYTIYCSPVSGYTTPAPQTVTVKAGQMATVSAQYTLLPPAITSRGTVAGTVGQPFSFQLTANPAPRSFAATGALPQGLALDSVTGFIRGTPTQDGTFVLQVHASNDQGPGQNSSLSIEIAAAGFLKVDFSGGGKVSAGFSPSSLRAVGSTVTIQATPNPGFLFAGWSRVDPNTGAATPVWRSAAYTFTMPASLNLLASFTENKFPLAAGTFNGLLTGTANNRDARGFLTLNLTSQGSFTGTAFVDQARYPLKGALDARGAFAGVIDGPAGQPDLVMNLQLELNTLASLSGLVSVGTKSLTLAALRSPFTAANPAPQALGQKTGAKYTVALPLPADPADPQGHGFGTVTITPLGVVTITGRSGEGAPISQTASLGPNGEWPFFCATPSGAITGPLSVLANPTAGTPAIGGALEWSGTFGANRFRSTIAARGATLPAKPLTGLSTVSLQIAGGGLNPAVPPIQVKIDPASGKGTASGVTGFSLQISPATGAFNGSFTDSGRVKHPFAGVLLVAPGATPKGYGNFLGANGTPGTVEF